MRRPAATTQQRSRPKWPWPPSKANAMLAERAQRFDVHPNQITEWRRQLVANAADAFATETERREPASDGKALHATIGAKALAWDCVARALGRGPGPNGRR